MTLEQIMDRIARNAGIGKEDHATGEYELIEEVVFEAITDILSRTRVNIRCADMELSEGVREYTVNGALHLHDLYFGADRLTEVQPGDIGSMFGRGAYAVVGFNRLVIGWDPAAGDELSAWYAPLPAQMSSPTDDPSEPAFGAIPVQFHSALVNYGSWKMSDIVGDVGSGRGEKYRILYEGRDGDTPVGSDLGKIMAATNRRAQSGSALARSRRRGDRIMSDVQPDFWQG